MDSEQIRTLLLNSRKQVHHVALRSKLKFMISKICYNPTDLMRLWVKQHWLWPVRNIDLVCEKQPTWNERAADLYSTAGEVKYANKYVLDFVSLVCRSSGRCYPITVLSQQLWRDERSSVIIFKERKDLLFCFCFFFAWVVWHIQMGQICDFTSHLTTGVVATFYFTCRARTWWTKVSSFHQHQGPGTRPPCSGWPLEHAA